MEKLYSPATIRKLKEKHDFRFSKSLGQNFLTDENIVNKIAEGAEIGSEDLVIEIGPGMGVLTAAAAEMAAAVIAVEIDSHLIPILRETLSAYKNVTIVNADIMKTDVRDLIAKAKSQSGRAFSGVKIIGNLPYYITTPILMKILEENGHGDGFDSITVMLQKEVAERINAEPGSKAYGALSLAVQYYCTVDMVASVPKEVFMPRPKVDSAVIRLNLRKSAPVKLTSPGDFFAVIKAGFGQRRKTLLNSLTGVCGLEKTDIAEILEQVGVAPQRRAETLSLREFADIANQCTAKKE